MEYLDLELLGFEPGMKLSVLEKKSSKEVQPTVMLKP